MAYHHILVAVDLTEEMDPVMARAVDLAERYHSTLSVIHVVEPLTIAFGGDVPMDISSMQQQHLDQSKSHFSRFTERYPQITKECQHLIYGHPRQEIHRIATEQQCDLIVTGSHGRQGLAVLLGSTAKDLLQNAPCDILAVNLTATD